MKKRTFESQYRKNVQENIRQLKLERPKDKNAIRKAIVYARRTIGLIRKAEKKD